MKKKILLLIVTLLLPVAVSKAATLIDGIYYELNSSKKSAIVSRSSDYSGSIVIPETITRGGIIYVVYRIETYAFRDCSELTSITIPSSVTSIGDYIFQGCSGLTSIIIDEKNQYYDSRNNCNAIIDSYSNTLIAGCKNTVIPNSVTTIQKYAFYLCNSLTSIDIPNSVTSIGSYAFDGCKALTSIIIPNSITSIGEFVFAGCNNLTSVSIPNSVTSIGKNAFNSCGFVSITIPNSVTSIEDGAFYHCSNLKSIVIPNSVTYISNSAFDGCKNLKAVTIHSEKIGKWFSKISSIEEVTIGDGVKSIEYEAFRECNNLTSVNMSNSLTTIGGFAFYGCKKLSSVDIPNSVTMIEGNAFRDCSGLKSVTLSNFLTIIRGSTFSGCTSLLSITIPNSVTKIESYAFEGCQSLKLVVLPNTITTIEKSTFENCYNLAEVTIPNSVNIIFSYAFNECRNLKSVIIGKSVQRIDGWAFYGCKSMKEVFCYSVNVPITNSSFSNSIIKNAILYVPLVSLTTYKSTSPWNNFKEIIPIEGGEEDDDDLQGYLDSMADSEDSFANGMYKREFRNGDWQTLYLPFTVNSSDWSGTFKVARIDGLAQYGDNRVLEATTIDNSNLEANYPYLICAKSNVGATLTVNVSSSTQAPNSMNFGGVTITGNYSQLKGLKSARRYRMQGGALSIPGSDEEVLQPYRWYMTIDNPAARELLISINGDEVTGIEDVEHSSFNTQHSTRPKDACKARTFNVYTLSGRRITVSSEAEIESLPKGIYLISNKKRVIK